MTSGNLAYLKEQQRVDPQISSDGQTFFKLSARIEALERTLARTETERDAALAQANQAERNLSTCKVALSILDLSLTEKQRDIDLLIDGLQKLKNQEEDQRKKINAIMTLLRQRSFTS
jgi:chromosome segregation ATPase